MAREFREIQEMGDSHTERIPTVFPQSGSRTPDPLPPFGFSTRIGHHPGSSRREVGTSFGRVEPATPKGGCGTPAVESSG